MATSARALAMKPTFQWRFVVSVRSLSTCYVSLAPNGFVVFIVQKEPVLATGSIIKSLMRQNVKIKSSYGRIIWVSPLFLETRFCASPSPHKFLVCQ